MAVTEGRERQRDATATQTSLKKGKENIHIWQESRTKTVLNCVFRSHRRAGCRHVRDSDGVVHQQALGAPPGYRAVDRNKLRLGGPRLSVHVQILLTLRALQWIVQ